MWILVVVAGLVLVTAVVYAFWPRRRGIVDGDVSRARRSNPGDVDPATAQVRGQFPPGGSIR